mmetsp:Transcript_2196/g.3452  ORF Transcript_2196/g.3452 Transcript_2196/m.3452 type:complete len:282 (-) Transcript_2196:937-1782(-)
MLPPHHCKSVTAILAIVQATMLTGASLQGNRVDCSSGRTPFCQLETEQERVKEFESRLTNALAALLFVALKASTTRKTNAIAARRGRRRRRDKQQQQSRKHNVPDFHRMQEQQVARKLRLCPTCRWHDETTPDETAATATATTPVARSLIISSFTNVDDLHSYVKSNMRSFTGRGGCALLLETIVRIHGKGTVERMVRKSRRTKEMAAAADDDGKHATTTTNSSNADKASPCSLIHCTCNERQNTVRPPRQAGTSAKNGPVLDTTPPGHDCLSVELLSLLI